MKDKMRKSQKIQRNLHHLPLYQQKMLIHLNWCKIWFKKPLNITN